jgi:hypothetical protein
MSFWSIKNAYNNYEVKNEHKDLCGQQSQAFVAKCFKEFDTANAKKIEAIKWDCNLLWHLISNEKCLPTTKRPKLP